MTLSKKKKTTAIVIGCIIGVLAVVYAVGCYFFSSHFFPNTTIGQSDISLASTDDFASDLNDKTENYVLTIQSETLNADNQNEDNSSNSSGSETVNDTGVSGGGTSDSEVTSETAGFVLQITKDDAKIAIDSNQVAVDACMNQNYWAWPVEVFLNHDASNVVTTMYDEEALEKIINKSVTAYNKTVPASKNATLTYDSTAGVCIVKEETYGSQLDAEKILEAAKICITSLVETYEFTDDDLLKPTILSSDERFSAALAKANTIVGGTIELTLNGSVSAGTINKKTIGSWITVDKELNPKVSSKKVKAWAEELGSDLNTVGSKRTYTRADGKKVTVSGGSYGWTVDTKDLASKVVDQLNNANFAAIDIPTTQSADKYDGKGKRDWGAYVDVDLKEQKARYYDANDKLLYSCNIVSGLPSAGRATPEGIYFVNLKQSPATLTGYNSKGEKEYETKVTYWMPFIGNSIGLHDATWQSSFGGSRYKTNGSHGCINLSLKDAKWFYDNLPKGTCVITHS